MQETFIRSMAHLPSLCKYSDGRRTAWLKRVLRNLFFNQRRAEKRRHQLMQEVTQHKELAQDIWHHMHPMWQLLVGNEPHFLIAWWSIRQIDGGL